MKIKLYLLVLSTVVFWGCSKNNSRNSNSQTISVDPNVFFTISFNGKTITTNGVDIHNSPSIPSFYFSTDHSAANVATYNINDSVVSYLEIGVNGDNINSIKTVYGPPQYIVNIPMQNCSANISLIKQGNTLGTYQEFSSTPNFCGITDLSVGYKTYGISPTNIDFNVTSADAEFVTGTFTCMLIDGTNLIPASGSFRLYNY